LIDYRLALVVIVPQNCGCNAPKPMWSSRFCIYYDLGLPISGNKKYVLNSDNVSVMQTLIILFFLSTTTKNNNPETNTIHSATISVVCQTADAKTKSEVQQHPLLQCRMPLPEGGQKSKPI